MSLAHKNFFLKLCEPNIRENKKKDNSLSGEKTPINLMPWALRVYAICRDFYWWNEGHFKANVISRNKEASRIIKTVNRTRSTSIEMSWHVLFQRSHPTGSSFVGNFHKKADLGGTIPDRALVGSDQNSFKKGIQDWTFFSASHGRWFGDRRSLHLKREVANLALDVHGVGWSIDPEV